MNKTNKNARKEQSENLRPTLGANPDANAPRDKEQSNESLNRHGVWSDGIPTGRPDVNRTAGQPDGAPTGQSGKSAADIIQQTGMATHDEAAGSFLFDPANEAMGRMEGYVRHGVAWRLTDGTFQFVQVPRLRSRAKLILKLPHGRLSHTVHDEVQLTLKFPVAGPLDIPAHLGAESLTAVEALDSYLLRLPVGTVGRGQRTMTGGEVLPPVPCSEEVDADSPAQGRAICLGPLMMVTDAGAPKQTPGGSRNCTRRQGSGRSRADNRKRTDPQGFVGGSDC